MNVTTPLPPPTETTTPKTVLIIGAGVAGLAAARLLRQRGFETTILDASPKCGGFHQDRQIAPYTFDLGSIFYEHESRVFDLAPGLRDLCPVVKRTQRRLDPANAVLSYPFEPSEIRTWGKGTQISALTGLATGRLLHGQDGTLDAICRRRLGSTVYTRSGLRNYIERFNLVDPKEVDEAFFFFRMGQVDRMTRVKALSARLRKAVSLRRQPPKAWRGLHVRPPEGYQALFTPVRQMLERKGVRFAMSENVKKIERKHPGFLITTENRQYRADAIVNSAPIAVIYEALFGRAPELEALGLLTLFVSSATLNERTGNVFYNFSHSGSWKRATIYSRIYPELGDGRAFFSVEHCIAPGDTPDPERAFAEFAQHMEEVGIVTDPRLEGYELTRGVYPVMRPGAPAKVEKALRDIAAAGIVSVGRQGRFEYLPTASLVARRVQEELGAIA